MIIMGVDFHPEFQQIASVDTDSGEFQEKRLAHREETEEFYRALAAAGQPVRVGMEASGHARWFERLLAELQFELWIGDASQIQSKRVPQPAATVTQMTVIPLAEAKSPLLARK
jgi:transposase